MRDQGRAGATAAPADRADQDFCFGQFFEDLQGYCGYTGDKKRLVGRVDVAHAALGGQPLHVLARLIEVRSVDDDFGSPGFHRRQLAGVAVLGHADDGAHPEESAGICDRLAVVSGGGGDHAERLLLLRHGADQIDPPAHFEGARRLVVLMLDVDFSANEVRKQRVGVERRGLQIRRNAAPGLPYQLHPIHICSPGFDKNSSRFLSDLRVFVVHTGFRFHH